MLIVFNDVIADMLNNKKINPTVTELFQRQRAKDFSFLLHNLILLSKNPNKQELQQIAFNYQILALKNL